MKSRQIFLAVGLKRVNATTHYAIMAQCDHQLQMWINPILTGGGSIWPPPARNPRLPRDRHRSRHAFSWLFSFKSYASFDTKFAKIGPSVARSRDVLYWHVGPKFAQKSAFCICLCTKHLEITDGGFGTLKRKKKHNQTFCCFCATVYTVISFYTIDMYINSK